jgi:hypothetical protein
MQMAGPRAQVPVDLALARAEFGHLKQRFYEPADHTPPPALVENDDVDVDGDFLTAAREQGGPRLAELRAALHDAPVGEAAATLFNSLPTQLRRPVEILGLMHVGADEAAFEPGEGTHTFEAIRPDGAHRRFTGPALIVTYEPEAAEQTQDAVAANGGKASP